MDSASNPCFANLWGRQLSEKIGADIAPGNSFESIGFLYLLQEHQRDLKAMLLEDPACSDADVERLRQYLAHELGTVAFARFWIQSELWDRTEDKTIHRELRAAAARGEPSANENIFQLLVASIRYPRINFHPLNDWRKVLAETAEILECNDAESFRASQRAQTVLRRLLEASGPPENPGRCE